MAKLVPVVLFAAIVSLPSLALADIATPRLRVQPAKQNKKKAPAVEASGETGAGESGSGETGSGETGSGETGSDETGSGETGGPEAPAPNGAEGEVGADEAAEPSTSDPAESKAETQADAKKAEPDKSGRCSVQAEDDALLGLTAFALLVCGVSLRRRR